MHVGGEDIVYSMYRSKLPHRNKSFKYVLIRNKNRRKNTPPKVIIREKSTDDAQALYLSKGSVAIIYVIQVNTFHMY